MSQQINLFDPSLRPRRRILTASRLAALLGGLAIAMLGYHSYLDNRLRQVEATLAQTNARLKDIQDRAARLGRTAARTKSQALEESIAKAESELGIRQTLLERLKGGDLGNTKGFSGYMLALARQWTEGIWITGLAVSGGGADFMIRGGVSRPEILPEYLRRLSREEVFRGKQVDDLRMERKEMELREQRAAAPAVPAGTAGAAGEQSAGRGGAAPRLRFVEFSITSGSMRSRAGG